MMLSTRDKTIIKIAACALVVLIAWLYGFNTFNEMASALERDNELLARQLDVLSRLQGGYETASDTFKQEAEQLLTRFPADVREEDEILYANTLSDKVPGTRVYYVTTPPAEELDVPVPNREDMLSNIVDATGEMSMNNYQSDGSILSVGEFVLKKATAAVSLQTDYAGLKKILTDIVTDENVKSIEDIALTFDGAGQVLNGAMNINFYALTNTGKEYVAPDAGAVAHGVQNIFGTGLRDNTAPVAITEEGFGEEVPAEGEALEEDALSEEMQGPEEVSDAQTAP